MQDYYFLENIFDGLGLIILKAKKKLYFGLLFTLIKLSQTNLTKPFYLSKMYCNLFLWHNYNLSISNIYMYKLFTI